MKSIKFKELLENELKNPKFRKEYEALEEEFSVAEDIIKLRIKNGITQKELAQKAHTSQSAIARLESGSYKNVSMSFLRKVGKVLGVEPHISFKKIKALNNQ